MLKSVDAMTDKYTEDAPSTLLSGQGGHPDTRSEGRSSPRSNGLPADNLKFADLASAGRDLARRLEKYLDTDSIVLAIARGGVPVALEVARHLALQLDIILIRRLLVPAGASSQICAVNVCGTLIIDQDLSPPEVPTTPLEYFLAQALDELAGRERACRGERPALDVAGKNLLVIDNGIHTGSTVLASIRALRKMKPAGLTVAAPVAARSSRAVLEPAVNELICLAWPEPFGHVGLWYSKYDIPDDAQVSNVLDQFSQGDGSD